MQATRQTAWYHQGMLSGELLHSREVKYKSERMTCNKSKTWMENLKITGIQQIMDIHGLVTGSWQVKGRNKFSLVIYILEQEDRMIDQQNRNHTARLRYTNSLQIEMSVTGELKPYIGFKYKHVYFITKAPPPS